jgi:hypothetical protein
MRLGTLISTSESAAVTRGCRQGVAPLAEPLCLILGERRQDVFEAPVIQTSRRSGHG